MTRAPLPRDDISHELERALVRELLAQWKQINATYFKGALRAPSLALTVARSVLGRYLPATRTLEMSRPLLLTQTWGSVVEVLKHEVAHQYVHEVLGAVDETPHGPAFRDVCRRLGIDAAASGTPLAPTPEEHRVVERIAKLLALAESPNMHEAEAATLAAQRLMLKHNLDARSAKEPLAYGHKQLGVPSGRVGEAERILASILGKHFFVEVIWVPAYRPHEGKRGSVLEICGTASNLAIAEYVHGFLIHTSAQLWEAHKRTRGIKNRERRTYLAGVMAGFAEKLAQEQHVHKRDGLVWVKDGDLDHFFRRRHPHVRHVRYAGQRKTETFAHGREAGKQIVLRRGVHGGPGAAPSRVGAGGPTRLLPPGPR